MTIVIDPVANYIRRGRPKRAAHLLSDRPPPAGTSELIEFAIRVHLSPRWIQKRGTPHEHFDLMGSRIAMAVAAGAVKIDRYRLVEIIHDKRSAIDRHVLLARCGLTPATRKIRPLPRFR